MKLHRLTYNEMLLQNAWKQKRQMIIERDCGACRNCGNKGPLQVHHRQYHRCARTGRKLAPWCYADHLLISLCGGCHSAGHAQYTIPKHTI